MLSLNELRNACALLLNVKPTFRALLTTSAFYEKNELGELLFNVDFTLLQFKKVITMSNTIDPAENRIIINTIKHVKAPTVLDLLFTLSESNLQLKIDLEKAGLNMDSFSTYLKMQIANTKISILDNIVSANSNSLIHLSNFRKN